MGQVAQIGNTGRAAVGQGEILQFWIEDEWSNDRFGQIPASGGICGGQYAKGEHQVDCRISQQPVERAPNAVQCPSPVQRGWEPYVELARQELGHFPLKQPEDLVVPFPRPVHHRADAH